MFKLVGVVVLSATLTTGCAMKNLFVSGVSLEALGNQFVETSQQVVSGCQDHVIPQQTCERYYAFGRNFQRVYPATVGMWEAARRADDKTTQGKAEDVARQLASDLAKLAAEVLRSFMPQESQ